MEFGTLMRTTRMALMIPSGRTAVVIVTIDTLSIPWVADSERIEIDPLGHTHDGIIQVTARFGYMETPDVRRALHVLEPEKTEGLIAIDDTRRISCRRSN